MKNKFYSAVVTVIAVIIMSATPSFSQPGIEWQKCLGGSSSDLAFSIYQTTDAGYIVAGTTMSNDGDVSGKIVGIGNVDVWLVKLSESGSMEWQKCLGGTNHDAANSIQQTADGGYILAGNTLSTNGDVSGKHADRDFWVVKLNSGGSIEWQKCLGGAGIDGALSIQQTADGGYIVSGHTTSNDGDVSGNHGNIDFWAVKLTSGGSIEWQKCLGGSGADQAISIQQTADGGYIATGQTQSNNGDVSGNHGSNDVWVVKLNTGGSIEWQKCLGGSGGDVANSIQQTADGGYIVAGQTTSNDGDVSGNNSINNDLDFWVVKLDQNGSIEWQKCLGGTARETANFIQQTADEGYIVTGEATSNDGDVSGNHGGNGDLWVVKLSSGGSMEWQKCLGGSAGDVANSIQQTADGGYVVAGYSLPMMAMFQRTMPTVIFG